MCLSSIKVQEVQLIIYECSSIDHIYMSFQKTGDKDRFF